MELENYTISGKHVLHYGELIIHESDVNDDFFIPGKYEFYLKEVHDLQRLVEINGTVYTNLRIPRQEEIVNVLAKTVEQIRDENWFTDSNLSQQQFATPHLQVELPMMCWINQTSNLQHFLQPIQYLLQDLYRIH